MAGWISVGSMAREFTSAHVRVRVWIPCDLPDPQFMTQWIDISTSDGICSFYLTCLVSHITKVIISHFALYIIRVEKLINEGLGGQVS